MSKSWWFNEKWSEWTLNSWSLNDLQPFYASDFMKSRVDLSSRYWVHFGCSLHASFFVCLIHFVQRIFKFLSFFRCLICFFFFTLVLFFRCIFRCYFVLNQWLDFLICWRFGEREKEKGEKGWVGRGVGIGKGVSRLPDLWNHESGLVLPI